LDERASPHPTMLVHPLGINENFVECIRLALPWAHKPTMVNPLMAKSKVNLVTF